MSAAPRTPITGSCLCGAVRYEIRGRASPITICHCSQCRKFHGAAGPYATCRREKIAIEGSTLRWYRSSERVRRGFCGECGSSLFWDRQDRAFLEIAAGTIDTPIEARVNAHIYVGSRAGWEHLDDGLPRHDGELPTDAS
jgi:hypothetical protein